MKWPWVGRANAERYEAYLEGCVMRERDQLRAEREAHDVTRHRCEALNERLLSLKMTGAVERPTLVASPEQIRRMTLQDQPDELRDLIDLKAGGNVRKRGMMLKQLAQDRADGMDEDKIAQRIADGISSDGVPS